MLTKRIIPCLDVKDGRVVKGVNFVDLVDAGDPVESAIAYDRAGADELIFLDITASSDKRDIIIDVIRRTADNIFLPLTVGGGIRTLDDIKVILRAGADKVSINTAAVHDPIFVKKASERFGSQCIVVAIDAKEKRRGNAWEVYTHGGRNNTNVDAIGWAVKMEEYGAGEILLTSMDRDGTNIGYDIPLTRTLSDAVNIPVIASGGAGNIGHLYEALDEGGADAVLAASIFHFGTYSIGEVKRVLSEKGVNMRMTK